MKKNSLLIIALGAISIASSFNINATLKERWQSAKNYIYNKYIYSESYIIKKEENKLDKRLKTFVLDKSAPTLMHPDKEQYTVGDYEYWVKTYYNRGTWKAIAEIKFVEGPSVKIIKPVRFIDYTLLSKHEINNLKNIMMLNIKGAKLENSSTSVGFKQNNKSLTLSVFYPSQGQKVNNAARRAVADQDWQTLEEILCMYKPAVSITTMEPNLLETYQVKNFDLLIKQIVSGLKRQNFSYEE